MISRCRRHQSALRTTDISAEQSNNPPGAYMPRLLASSASSLRSSSSRSLSRRSSQPRAQNRAPLGSPSPSPHGPRLPLIRFERWTTGRHRDAGERRHRPLRALGGGAHQVRLPDRAAPSARDQRAGRHGRAPWPATPRPGRSGRDHRHRRDLAAGSRPRRSRARAARLPPRGQRLACAAGARRRRGRASRRRPLQTPQPDHPPASLRVPNVERIPTADLPAPEAWVTHVETTSAKHYFA
jgi:hypothetical protein